MTFHKGIPKMVCRCMLLTAMVSLVTSNIVTQSDNTPVTSVVDFRKPGSPSRVSQFDKVHTKLAKTSLPSKHKLLLHLLPSRPRCRHFDRKQPIITRPNLPPIHGELLNLLRILAPFMVQSANRLSKGHPDGSHMIPKTTISRNTNNKNSEYKVSLDIFDNIYQDIPPIQVFRRPVHMFTQPHHRPRRQAWGHAPPPMEPWRNPNHPRPQAPQIPRMMGTFASGDVIGTQVDRQSGLAEYGLAYPPGYLPPVEAEPNPINQMMRMGMFAPPQPSFLPPDLPPPPPPHIDPAPALVGSMRRTNFIPTGNNAELPGADQPQTPVTNALERQLHHRNNMNEMAENYGFGFGHQAPAFGHMAPAYADPYMPQMGYAPMPAAAPEPAPGALVGSMRRTNFIPTGNNAELPGADQPQTPVTNALERQLHQRERQQEMLSNYPMLGYNARRW